MDIEKKLRRYIEKKYGRIDMGVKNYGGALTLKDVNRVVITPLEKYKPFYCPDAKHTEYKRDCVACVDLYGEHDV